MMLAQFKGFQWPALMLVGVFLAISIAGCFRKRGARRAHIFWTIIWLTAGLTIAWPEITVHLAHALGIGRGTDLVLYCAVLFMLVGFLVVYARLRKLNREITLIARHIALREADSNADSGGEGPALP